MEAASDKRPRGRPRRFTSLSPDLLERVVGGRMVGTVRGRQDRLYAALAETQLRDIKPDAWLLGPGRQGLLAQLGRILREDKWPPALRATAFLRLVAFLEKERPKTKQGERAIRAWRRSQRAGR